jgi:hypothetical protein
LEIKGRSEFKGGEFTFEVTKDAIHGGAVDSTVLGWGIANGSESVLDIDIGDAHATSFAFDGWGLGGRVAVWSWRRRGGAERGSIDDDEFRIGGRAHDALRWVKKLVVVAESRRTLSENVSDRRADRGPLLKLGW